MLLQILTRLLCICLKKIDMSKPKQQNPEQPFQKKLSNFYEQKRSQIFSHLWKYFENGYKYAIIKNTDKPNQEFRTYIRAYEDVFLLQVTGLMFMGISGVYFALLYVKKDKLKEDVLKRVFLRGGFFSGIATLLTGLSFYLNHKHKVLNKTEIYNKKYQELVQSMAISSGKMEELN